MGKDHVVGWALDRAERNDLLAALPPAYPVVVADHVTLQSKVSADHPVPDAKIGDIVGVSDDGCGVQAMVVRIDGTTNRPGGGTYHITWSLAPGRQAVESNTVIAEHGWALTPVTPVRLKPARYP